MKISSIFHSPCSWLTLHRLGMQYPYLLSKRLDPLFAVAIGVASYYSYEKRTGKVEGHRLNDLIAQRYHQWNQKSEK